MGESKVPSIKVPDFITKMMADYGKKGVCMEGGSVECDFFDTGNIALNFILSGNFDYGYPTGQVISIAGDPATGKSLLMKHAMAEFLKKYKNGVVVLDDTENAYVSYLGSETGIDQTRFVRISTDSVEEHAALLFDGVKVKTNPKKNEIDPIIPALAEGGVKDILVVVDSIAAWSTEHEQEVGLTKTDMSKPKVLKALFRTLKSDIKKYNVTYMFTNHMIYTMGDVFMPARKVEPGGGGPAFQASIRLCLALAAKIKEKGDEKTKNEDNNIIGIVTKAQTQKNRFSPPFRTCSLKIMFNGGVDRWSGLVDLLVHLGVLELGNGGWYNIVGTHERIQSKDIVHRWDSIRKLIKPENVKMRETVLSVDEEDDNA